MANMNQVVADHWDRVTHNPNPARSRWWMSDKIIRHINKRVCGKDIPGVNQGLIVSLNKMTGGKKFKKGLSIGCGGGTKELNLVRQGIVEHFDLYELSQSRCNLAKETFRKYGFEERVNVINQEFSATDSSSYDFVHWDNSLHHMPDTDKAIFETYGLLESGGIFFMNDFIGKSRFQWSDAELEVINTFRDCLPDDFFVLPDGKPIIKHIDRPNIQLMIDADPSEAADSESIIPSLKKRLKDPKILLTGGVIYHIGLNDIMVNISEESPIMSLALLVDSLASKNGLNQYGVCLAVK